MSLCRARLTLAGFGRYAAHMRANASRNAACLVPDAVFHSFARSFLSFTAVRFHPHTAIAAPDRTRVASRRWNVLPASCRRRSAESTARNR
eukprot:3237106-Rhodomonas_salina.2